MTRLFLLIAALFVVRISLAMEDKFPKEIYLHIAENCSLKDVLNISQCSSKIYKTMEASFFILLAKRLSPYEIQNIEEAKRILRFIDKRNRQKPIDVFGIEDVVYYCQPSSGRDTALTAQGQVFQKCSHGGILRHVLELISLPLAPDDQVIAIEQYHLHALALTESGKVYAWGDNSKGQLGLGVSSKEKIAPTLIEFLNDKNIVSLATGGNHSMAVSLAGQVYAWGNNDRAELALGHTENVNVPTLIQGFNNEPVISLELSNLTGLALTANGRVYVFGPNDLGYLGLGHNELICCPTCSDPHLSAGRPAIKNKTWTTLVKLRFALGPH